MSTPHSFDKASVQEFFSSPILCANGGFSQPTVDGLKGMKAHLAQVTNTGNAPIHSAHL